MAALTATGPLTSAPLEERFFARPVPFVIAIHAAISAATNAEFALSASVEPTTVSLLVTVTSAAALEPIPAVLAVQTTSVFATLVERLVLAAITTYTTSADVSLSVTLLIPAVQATFITPMPATALTVGAVVSELIAAS